MARQNINIGVIGNDGTGDAVREAFRKVNDNFRELYGALGLGERLTFSGLSDTPPTYVNNKDCVVTTNSTETGIVYRKIVGTKGIDVRISDDAITIVSTISEIADDRTPTLGGPLNSLLNSVRNPIFNLPDLSNTSEVDAVKTIIQSTGDTQIDVSRVAANVGYVNTKLAISGIRAVNPVTGTVDPSLGVLTGPVVYNQELTETEELQWQGNILTTKRYVDESRSSLVNLYVAKQSTSASTQLKGRSLSTAFTSLSEALQLAEEIVLRSPITLSPTRKKLTYNNGIAATLHSVTPYAVTGSGLSTQVVMELDQVSVYSSGTGYSVGDRISIEGDSSSNPCEIEVTEVTNTSTNIGAVSKVKITRRGEFEELPGVVVNTTTTNPLASGLVLSLTYRVLSVLVLNGGSGFRSGTVQITSIAGTGASAHATVVSGSVTEIQVESAGSGYIQVPQVAVVPLRMFVSTNNFKSDLTNSWLKEGMIVVGESSLAAAKIVKVTNQVSQSGNTQGCEMFDVEMINGSFSSNETLLVGYAERANKVVVHVETGTYYEEFPLHIPEGVTVKGDSANTTEICPSNYEFSISPWVFAKFYRSESHEYNLSNCLHHYLTDPVSDGKLLVSNHGQHYSALRLIRQNELFLSTQISNWYKNYENVNQFSSSYLPYLKAVVSAVEFDLEFGSTNRVTSAVLNLKRNVPNSHLVNEFLVYLTSMLIQIVKNEQVTILFDSSGNQIPPLQLFITQTINNTISVSEASYSLINQIVTSARQLYQNTTNLPKPNSQIDAILLSANSRITDIKVRDFSANAFAVSTITPPVTSTPAAVSRVNITSHSSSAGVFVDGFASSQRVVIKSIVNDREVIVESDQPVGNYLSKIHLQGKFYTVNSVLEVDYSENTVQSRLLLDTSTPVETEWGVSNCVLTSGQNNEIIVTSVQPHGLDNTSSVVLHSENLPATVSSGIVYNVETVSTTSFKIKLDQTTVTGSGNSTPASFYRVATLHVDEQTCVQLTDTVVSVDNSVGIHSTNNALVEASQVTTQYASIGMLSTNGGAIQSSNSRTEYGHYGLVAHGSDPIETHQRVALYKPLAQGAEVILSTQGDNTAGSKTLLVKYDDYAPVPGSEVEVNHYNVQSHYEVLFAHVVDSSQKIARITILETTGLVETVPAGQRITIRQLNSVILNGNAVNTTTKPSTALVLDESDTIYRVVEFENFSEYDSDVIRVVSIDTVTGVITTTPHRQQPGNLIQFEIALGDVLPVEIERLSNTSNKTRVYKIHEVVSATQFSIAQENSTQPIVFSTTATRLTTTVVKPYGVVLAQLKEGFNYVSLDVNSTQSLADPDRLKSVSTIQNQSVTLFNSANHNLYPNTPVKFVASEYSYPVTEESVFWVTRENLSTSQFSITDRARVPSFVTGTGIIDATGVITGLFTTAGLYPGMRVYPVRMPPGSGSLPSSGTPQLPGTVIVNTQLSPLLRSAIISRVCGYPMSFVDGESLVSYTNFLNPLSVKVASVQTAGSTVRTKQIPNFVREQVISDLFMLEPVHSSNSMMFVATSFLKNARVIVDTLGAGPAAPTGNSVLVQDFVIEQVFSVSPDSPEVYAFRKQLNSLVFGNVRYTTTPEPEVIPSDGNWTFNPVILEVLGPNSVRISDYEYIRTGEIEFDAEGAPITLSGNLVDAKFGKLNGDIGQTQFEVTNVSPVDLERLVGSEFYFEGNPYRVLSSTTQSGSVLISLDRPLQSTILKYESGFVIKSAVTVPSSRSHGSLIARISTITASSHSLKQAGAGLQSEVAEIDPYDRAVDLHDSIPLFTADSRMNVSDYSKSIVQERSVGRVFYETTDQYGKYSVGSVFEVDQSSGQVTLSSQIALNHLAGLGFRRGVTINEFSVDDTMLDGANDAVPTEGAVKGYVARCLGFDHTGRVVDETDLIPDNGQGGVMALSGLLPMKGNLNFGNNRGINVKEPQLPSDVARLDSITYSNLKDTDQQRLFNFANVRSGDLVALANNGNKMSNYRVVGHMNLVPSGSDLVALFSPNVVTDEHVNANARISQSKLLLNPATTRENSTNLLQNDLGVASFDSRVFVSTNGWVTLKPASLGFSYFEQIPQRTLLGNTRTTTGTVEVIPLEDIVNSSGAIKKSQFTRAGYIKRTTSTSGIPLDDANYTIVDDSSTPTPNTLVRRDPNGDTAVRSLAASDFKLTTTQSGSFVALKTTEVSGTSGYVEINSFNVPGVSAFTGIQIGNGSGINKTLYNNNSHEFRNQTGNITFAIVDATGIDIQSRTLKVNTVSPGSNSLAGTLQGTWTVSGVSSQPKVTVMNGVSLAEYCQGDSTYEPGTVVVYGGSAEITISTTLADTRVAGVVSTDAAYAMNGSCPAPRNLVAMQGRVECYVVGNIQKGDLLVSSATPGVATAAQLNPASGTVIGKAMQSYNSNQVGKILVAVGRS